MPTAEDIASQAESYLGKWPIENKICAREDLDDDILTLL
jgi:hypothetical protein